MRDKQKQNFDFTVKWFDSRERNLGLNELTYQERLSLLCSFQYHLIIRNLCKVTDHFSH